MSRNHDGMQARQVRRLLVLYLFLSLAGSYGNSKDVFFLFKYGVLLRTYLNHFTNLHQYPFVV